MKNSAQILSHLQHQPQFSKLSRYACIKSVQKLFPPHLQKLIRYGYIRNRTLFFVFAHPGAKQEFDIIAESIRQPLKEHPPIECRDCPFDTVKAFVSHRLVTAPTAVKKPQPCYRERASGRFTNCIGDEKLHAMFEQIRAIIHARAD